MEVVTKTISWLSALVISIVLFFLIGDIIYSALGSMDWSFIFDSPSSAGRKGGIFPIIISTFLILLVTLAVVIPIGLGTALYLSQYSKHKSNKHTQMIRKAIEVLSSVPSIVFGLFGNAVFSVFFDFGFSILSGGLTLALMALPLFITTAEKGLSSVPRQYHQVAYSLGLSDFTIAMVVLIPYALPSILSAIILSIGRSLAETAALIFTSGYVDRMPESIFDSGRSLSIHIYDLTMNVPGGDANAYKSSFVLIVFILFINIILNTSLRRWYKKRISL